MKTFLLIIICFSVCLAASVQRNPKIRRHALDKNGLVPTPAGYRPKECVHHIPNGYRASQNIDGSITVISALGNFRKFPPCKSWKQMKDKEEYEQVVRTPHSKNLEDSGWITWGSVSGQSYNSFNGTWNVPQAPSSNDQQLLYFFTGLEDAQGDEIIQPVLQWGTSPAGGGAFWAVASWWVTSTGQSLYSSLSNANPGDTIDGTMQEHSPGSWTIDTLVNGGNLVSLSVSNVAPQQMASVTLEAYNVAGCNDYPADGSMTFSNLILEDSGTVQNPSWTPNVDFSNCGQGVSQNGADVTISY